MCELCCTTSRAMHQVCRDVESVTDTLWRFLPTLFIFEALVCTAHSFPGMRDFLFGYGEEEWRDDVAEGRKERY